MKEMKEVRLNTQRGDNRASLVYALQNWLSESPDQAARKPGSNPGILGVAMGFMAVFVVCSLLPSFPPSQIPLLSLFRDLLRPAPGLGGWGGERKRSVNFAVYYMANIYTRRVI